MPAGVQMAGTSAATEMVARMVAWARLEAVVVVRVAVAPAVLAVGARVVVGREVEARVVAREEAIDRKSVV